MSHGGCIAFAYHTPRVKHIALGTYKSRLSITSHTPAVLVLTCVSLAALCAELTCYDDEQQRAAQSGAARSVPPAPAPAGRPQKQSEYTGVRLRQWGRWAAEVRVPGIRQKLWIGTFETDRQAALAYDAAVFCFYGVHLPRRRKFNYPGAPRPDIPAWVRVQLNVATVKAVAERHARAVDARLPPLVVAAATAAVAAAPPSAGEGASAPVDDDSNGMDDGESLVTRAVDGRSLCSIDAEEVAGESADVVRTVHG